MQEDYSKLTRKIAIDLHKIVESKKLSEEVNNRIFLNSLNYIDTYSYLKKIQLIGIGERSYRFARLISTMIRTQMYTDYYRNEKYLSLLSNKKLNVISYEEFLNNGINNHFENSMVSSLERFPDLSGYEKVLQTKSLNEQENIYLIKNNPFYEYEKNKYDIEITLDFIKKHIGIWQKCFNDEEKSYDGAADFIYKLNIIRTQEAKNLLMQICEFLSVKYDEKILLSKSQLKELLKKYYLRSNEELKSKKLSMDPNIRNSGNNNEDK